MRQKNVAAKLLAVEQPLRSDAAYIQPGLVVSFGESRTQRFAERRILSTFQRENTAKNPRERLWIERASRMGYG